MVLHCHTYKSVLQNPEKSYYIKWVKAHVGVRGNERADELAKSVILDGIYDKIRKIPYPISVIKNYIKENIMKEWQVSWTVSEKGRDTYKVLNKVDADYLCPFQISILSQAMVLSPHF